MEGKGVMDAETWAIIRALHIANGKAKKIRIFTDSRNAKDWVLNPRKEGHLAYMWEILCEATKEKGSEIEISWVKGHAGNKGNERADALARKGGEKNDPWEGKSHAASAHEISEERNREWKKWFNEKEHYYKRQPRRKLKHLRGLSREDATAVFRIRSDKGWGKTAIERSDDREQCKCREKMSSDHVLSCDEWKDGRPTTNPQQDSSTWGLAKWAREQGYFGIPPKYYPVRWVNLRGGNIDRRKPQICYVCKTSYPSEEAMRNHAKRDHGGHKQVEMREAKSKNFGEDMGTTCPTYKKSYASQRTMRQHMKTAHGATLGSQICKACDKRFPTKLALREHQRTNCDGGRS